MNRETPEEKYERIRNQVRGAILREYPNPSRTGCPGAECLADIAGRVADFDGTKGGIPLATRYALLAVLQGLS